MKKFFLALWLLMVMHTVSAQTQIQNSGWFALFNSTKLTDKWGLAFDFQVRSADNWGYIRNVLVRPGITYYLNEKSNITAGYLYVPSFSRQLDVKSSLLEQRIWEQFIYNHKLKSAFVTHRARLEQRFIETNTADNIFAQRLRYFVRLVQPLGVYHERFDKGVFLALQDEVFLNVQNKELLNDHFFDQNRFYIAIGYRVSKKIDIEGGYLNQYVRGAQTKTSNRVAQLAVYTRF